MPVKFFHLIKERCISKYNTKLFTGGSAEKQTRRFCRLLQGYAGNVPKRMEFPDGIV